MGACACLRLHACVSECVFCICASPIILKQASALALDERGTKVPLRVRFRLKVKVSVRITGRVHLRVVSLR